MPSQKKKKGSMTLLNVRNSIICTKRIKRKRKRVQNLFKLAIIKDILNKPMNHSLSFLAFKIFWLEYVHLTYYIELKLCKLGSCIDKLKQVESEKLLKQLEL